MRRHIDGIPCAAGMRRLTLFHTIQSLALDVSMRAIVCAKSALCGRGVGDVNSGEAAVEG